jgi:hypothetical protein
VREEGKGEEGGEEEGRWRKEGREGQAPLLLVGGGVGSSLSTPSPSFVHACCVHTCCCCWEGGFVVGTHCCAWVWCGGLVVVIWSLLVWAVVVGGHGMSVGDRCERLSPFAMVLCDDER